MLQGEEELDEEEEAAIAASPDEGIGREGGARVVTLEQCLAWGGEQRQRCRLVIAVSGTPLVDASLTWPGISARPKI